MGSRSLFFHLFHYCAFNSFFQAVRDFSKGEFVVEYAGDLIDVGTAKDLEAKYSMDTSKGSYMYYFKHKGKQYW